MISSGNSNLTNIDDLAFNRTGRVSPSQVARYASRKKGRYWMFVIVCILVVAILVLIGLYTQQTGEDATSIMISAIIVGGIFVLLLIPITIDRIRGWRVGQELAEGRAIMADGHVTWKGGKLVAETADRRLRSIFNETFDLMPGPYRFYYLPQSGGLLAVEVPGLSDPSTSRQELRIILAQANHFDPAALEINHTGRMAAGQQRRLILSSGIYFLGAIFVGIFAYGFSIPLRDNLPDLGSLIFPGLILLGILAVAFMVAWRGVRVIHDAVDGKVLSRQGSVNKSVRRGRTTVYYYSMGGSMSWMVSRRAYNALVEGVVYRVYYAPRSHLLVAIEPV